MTVAITSPNSYETLQITLFKYDPDSEVTDNDLEITPASAVVGFPGGTIPLTGKFIVTVW